MSQCGFFLPGGAGAVVTTLTGNAGGAVGPTVGNINIIGGTGILVTGDPGASTLTITHGGAVSDSFITDAGTAVPVLGDTNILGGANINTTGAGNTVTAILNDDVTLAGFLTAGTVITAGTGVIATTGNIVATLGNLTADAGNITATLGNLEAGATLTVGTTVTFTSHTDGGLIVDGSGVVTSSAAVTHATGFATWTGAGNYFDDTILGDFEVLRGGTGYINSVPITWAGPQTVSGLAAGNTYLIYMDDTGTIGKTTSFTQATFDDYIVLFQCLRDSTAGTNIQYTVKENHPSRFCSCISFYCHEVIGTVIANNDRGANITLDGTQKIEIVGADELADHGLYTDIPDGGGTPETWHNMLTNAGGKWITYRSNDTFNGYWNSGGTATAPTGTKFSIYTLYIGKDTITVATPTYWAVLDDQEYNNLAAAQTAIANGTMAIATAELAELEFAQLGHIIYKQSTDTIVDVIIEKSTLRGTVSGGGGTNLASLVLTDVTNFDGILGAGDTTVQVALDTIDEWGKTTTDHAVLIGQGTGTPIISLAVAGNGELIIGSVGADPAVGSITSTDGSLTVTAGAGTLVIEGTAAAEAQVGSVELATDAEAIDGTDAVRAIVPTSLKAKLGTQTDHGVLVGSGTTAAITALGVATNGQLIVGSTGADPVIASVISTDGTIIVTGGAGTLDLEGIDATTAQEGVVELTTDAEAIAGTDTTRAVTAEALKAKLGAQTDHGVLVGSATTAAITALAVGTDGQVLVGSTGADPVFATISDGTGITTTLGAGTLAISSTGTTLKDETGTTYTFIIGDEGKFFTFTNAAAITVTVPTNAAQSFAIGTVLAFQQGGAGQVTLSGAVPPTLKSADNAYTTVKLYSVGCIVKIATDVWAVGGDMEA